MTTTNDFDIVEHDGVTDHQTCTVCRRTWGEGIDEYKADGIEIDFYDDGSVCPDQECAGWMGMKAPRREI